MVAETQPLFSLGQVVATQGCLELLEKHGKTASEFIHRHVMGDWGVVDSEDAQLNQDAVQEGSRILSVYEVGDERVWVITEWDRSVTTLLLPSEY